MNHPVFGEGGLQLGHLLQGGAAADALVGENDVAFRILDADNLVVKGTGILRCAGFLMGVQRELV